VFAALIVGCNAKGSWILIEGNVVDNCEENGPNGGDDASVPSNQPLHESVAP